MTSAGSVEKRIEYGNTSSVCVVFTSKYPHRKGVELEMAVWRILTLQYGSE